jgi:hypothetical protein
VELRRILQFDEARIEKFSVTPADDIKGVIGIAATMTREHAETLNCDYLLNGTVVREGLGDSVPLDIELQNVELHFPERSTMFPETVHKFKLRRIPDAKFEIAFLAHLPAHLILELAEFVEKTNKDTFACAIRSRQGELFEGGTRVDLSEKEDDAQDSLFACPHCDNDVPLTDDGTGHVIEEGEVVPCTHPSATAVAAMKASREPALASAGEMKRL